jgi:ubiquitin-conjugating enzyme E2 N
MSRHRGAIQGAHQMHSSAIHADEEVKKVVPPPIPKLDPEKLEWSDEESDWKVKESPQVLLKTALKLQAKHTDIDEPDAIDAFEYKDYFYEKALEDPNQPEVLHHYTNKIDHKRTKLKELHGDTIDKLTRGVKGTLPHEIRKPNYDKYDYPLPILPSHVKLSLGLDIIEHLWYEFIMHGCDESELIKMTKLKKITLKMEKHIGYRLPEFNELIFPGLDKNDYIEFTSVCCQLALIGEKRHVRIQKAMSSSIDIRHPLMRLPMPSCCAIDSCQFVPGAGMNPIDMLPKSLEQEEEEEKKAKEQAEAEAVAFECKENGGGDDDDDDDGPNVDLHALKVAYITHRLKLHGNLRLKHIPDIMEHAQIPYDKSRYPSSEWELKGEVLISSIDECLLVSNMIRTDLDEKVSNETDPKYKLPLWMEDEFKPSEIMLFKHHFKSIDIDGGGELDEEELQTLTESLGSRVTIEEAKDLIAIMDLDGGGTVSFDEFMMLMYKIQNGVIDLGDNLLAKSMVAAKSQITIFEEIEENMSNPVPGSKVINYGGSPVDCDFVINGPKGSPYEGGNFKLRITLLDGYPFKCPTVTFITRIFHVNILLQFDGNGYMQHLSSLWDSSWNIRKIVEHALHILANPQIDYVPIDMIHIVKVFLSEKLAVAQELDRERRAELQRNKDEREAEANYAKIQQDEYNEFIKNEEIKSNYETRLMAGEDPIENAVEIEDMIKYDENMAVVLSLDEEDELNIHMQTYRDMYAQEKIEQDEANSIAEQERLEEEMAEKARLDAEEQAEWDAGQDPTLALLEGLIGNDEVEDDSNIDPRFRKVVAHKTSDELMKPLQRQQQMHLATIQMFLFENVRYMQAIQGYVEKFAKVNDSAVKFDEDCDGDGDVDDSVVSGNVMIDNMDGTEHVHHGEHEVNEVDLEHQSFDHGHEHEFGDGPSLYYKDGRKRKNPNIDDESSESEGDDDLGAGFD